MLCLCSLAFFFVTGLSGFVVCILRSCFLFLLFCFDFFAFFIPLNKTTKGWTLQKHNKNKNAEKRGIFSVSAVVFPNSDPNSFGVGLNADSETTL